MSAIFSRNATASEEATLETEVLIIGGGVTGAGIMRDLALREPSLEDLFFGFSD